MMVALDSAALVFDLQISYLIPLLVFVVALAAGFMAVRATGRRRRGRAAEAAKPESGAPPVEEKGRLKFLTKLSALFARSVNPRTRTYIVAGSVLATLAMISFATFVYPTYSTRPLYDNYVVVILVVGLFPPSITDLVNRRYRAMIDVKIPDFLREIAESQRTGTPFTKSLVNASQSNFGPLSEELQKAMAKMSWGLSFEEALDSFAQTVDTPLAHRAAVLLKEVGRSGGKMLEVLDSVYAHIRDVINLQRERAKQLTPYVAVIYASFGVYLFVVYILFSTFFAQVSHLQSSGAPFGSNIDPAVYYIWFFHMSIIESVFGGLVVGKISSGSSVAGTKHMLVLLAAALVFFLLLIKY